MLPLRCAVLAKTLAWLIQRCILDPHWVLFKKLNQINASFFDRVGYFLTLMQDGYSDPQLITHSLFQQSLHPLYPAFPPLFDPPGGCISSWHLSPFIVTAGASLALLKIHTQALTSTPLAYENQCGVEEGRMLPTLLPGANLPRRKLKRLHFISKINIKVVMWHLMAKERLVWVDPVSNYKKLWAFSQLLVSVPRKFPF